LDKSRAIIVILVLALVAETSFLAFTYVTSFRTMPAVPQQTQIQLLNKSFIAPYALFNQPISNDSEFTLDDQLNGSWTISISSSLIPSSSSPIRSEAQIAIAPEYPVENLSIPTIIVQQRGDGLLRIEYYAQNWNNTFGLILYNSTSPTWTSGENVTIRFLSYAPPVGVNPQVAPYPNGNLTISVGNTIVLSNYPIAWAGLSDFYVYGLRGSSFVSGTLTISVYEVRSEV